jgi:hypothetical protein
LLIFPPNLQGRQIVLGRLRAYTVPTCPRGNFSSYVKGLRDRATRRLVALIGRL